MGLLFIVFHAGLIINTWETFLSSAGKQTILQFWFGNFLSSLFISYPGFTGPPIFLCLPETFHSKYLFFNPSTQTLCEEILCLS